MRKISSQAELEKIYLSEMIARRPLPKAEPSGYGEGDRLPSEHGLLRTDYEEIEKNRPVNPAILAIHKLIADEAAERLSKTDCLSRIKFIIKDFMQSFD